MDAFVRPLNLPLSCFFRAAVVVVVDAIADYTPKSVVTPGASFPAQVFHVLTSERLPKEKRRNGNEKQKKTKKMIDDAGEPAPEDVCVILKNCHIS
jgi:hypothetical protein